VVATGALAGSGASLRAWGTGQVIAPTLAVGSLKPSDPLDEKYRWKVRSQFNILDGMTFMNNGFSAISRKKRSFASSTTRGTGTACGR
jgi:hypothetical protein